MWKKIVNKLAIHIRKIQRYYIRAKLIKKGLHIDEGGWIDKTAIIVAPENIKIGRECRINEYVYLRGSRGHITIGDYVTFSPHSKVVSSGYDLDIWCEKMREFILRIEKYISMIMCGFVWVR